MLACMSSLALQGPFRRTDNLNVIAIAVLKNAKTANEFVYVFRKFIGYIVYPAKTSTKRFVICIRFNIVCISKYVMYMYKFIY